MRIFWLIIAFLLTSFVVAAEENVSVYQGFSGGMMAHAGYLFGVDKNAPSTSTGLLCSPQGASFGLGGSLRVNLWKHLRVGGEGFVATMNSSTTNMKNILKDGSYIRTGWGGAIIDACWRQQNVWPYIGASFGGGARRALYILDGDQEDWAPEANAVFHKQSFFYVLPYVGMDWCLTHKVHMTFRLDWMIAFHKSEILQPSGPRILVGFMFCH